MNARSDILALQRAQLQHDAAYHQDILVLDTARRAKHMALHNAKYTGRFVAAVEDGDSELFGRTLTDAFIISVATANTFSQDIGAELLPEFGECVSLQDLGERLFHNRGNESSFVREYAIHTGNMAKACESLDHLEDFPFRSQIVAANLGIFEAIVAEASVRRIDVTEAYSERISEVESKSPRNFLL